MNQQALKNVLNFEQQKTITNLLRNAKNMGASLEKTAGFPLRKVNVEKGYAHLLQIIDLSGPNGFLIELAYAIKGTVGFWHTHETLEVVCVYSGSVTFKVENTKEMHLDAVNPVGIFLPKVKHKPIFPEECKAICILIPADPQLKL